MFSASASVAEQELPVGGGGGLPVWTGVLLSVSCFLHPEKMKMEHRKTGNRMLRILRDTGFIGMDLYHLP